MEVLSCAAAPCVNNFLVKACRTASLFSSLDVCFPNLRKNMSTCNCSLQLRPFPSLASRYISQSATSATSSTSLTSSSSSFPASVGNRYWIVHMDKPPRGMNSKADVVDYYVETLQKVLGNEREAQMSIYDASYDTHFGFCCDMDEEASRELACLPGVLSVRPDLDYDSKKKDYSFLKQLRIPLFAPDTVKRWIVRIGKPGVAIVTKAQMVDHCVRLLTKVLGNEKDAQMCIYHISWQSNFGFCCELGDECAEDLVGVPGVLAVLPDKNFESQNKDYGGHNSQDSTFAQDSSNQTPIKTKKLFITGLSFYTSEKTLRAAFEGFGELVGVKIIMDKISKRSKGYAFVEYMTEEAASAALKEMNGKIINGWMIVVDVAKTKPSKYGRSQPVHSNREPSVS